MVISGTGVVENVFAKVIVHAAILVPVVTTPTLSFDDAAIVGLVPHVETTGVAPVLDAIIWPKPSIWKSAGNPTDVDATVKMTFVAVVALTVTKCIAPVGSVMSNAFGDVVAIATLPLNVDVAPLPCMVVVELPPIYSGPACIENILEEAFPILRRAEVSV